MKILIIILLISLTGCETLKCAKQDFKNFKNDVFLNIGHPMDKNWREGTSKTYKD